MDEALSMDGVSVIIFIVRDAPGMNAESWFHAAEENLHGHLLALAGCAATKTMVRPDMELFALGGADIPEFNLAYLRPKGKVDLDDVLATCHDFYSCIDRRYLINAHGLEAELLRRGWSEEDPFQAMHLDLAHLPRSREPTPGVEVREVLDHREMDVLSNVLCPSWGIAPHCWQGVSEMMRGLVTDRDGAFRGYVLYTDGAPASSLLIFTQGEIAGVQLVSTLPSQRGKGWAQRLLIEALQDSKRTGATDSVLEATSMGVRSYERIGFEGCGWSRYFSPP